MWFACRRDDGLAFYGGTGVKGGISKYLARKMKLTGLSVLIFIHDETDNIQDFQNAGKSN